LPQDLLEVEATENILLKTQMAVADALACVRSLAGSAGCDDLGNG
jgi:hypothetical protein